MMTANDRQVGGSHYDTVDASYKHWDWVIAVGLGYLDGQATKYVARWDKKGTPLQDLEKALHYTQKFLENWTSVHRLKPTERWIRECTVRFVKSAGLGESEAEVCLLFALGKRDYIIQAQDTIAMLLEQADRAKPVPLEDSNKHGERA